MMHRALVIGSQTAGLQGVHNDVEAIKQELDARHFVTDVRTEADASRDGILDGYRKLIQESSANDAAVIYYSGHGGRGINPRFASVGIPPKHLQFLVPTDFGDSAFRGILDFELSGLQLQLTDKTRNVAVILDCCHAARMSRNVQRAPTRYRVRALGRDWIDGIEEHLTMVAPKAIPHFDSNPYAVRLAATEADKSAFEYVRSDGTMGGVMTDSLLLVLLEAGDLPVSWFALGMRVRERVLSKLRDQRPEIEGPIQRLLFDTKESDRTGAVTYFNDNGVPSLRAGRLLGSAVGAEYGIMPLGLEAYSADQEVARATVTALAGNTSRLKLDFKGNVEAIQDGALAYPLRVPFQRRGVLLSGTASEMDALRPMLDASKHVCISVEEQNAITRVECSAGTLQIFDPDDVAVTYPIPSDERGRRNILTTLTNLAKSDALRKLQDGGLGAEIRYTFGRLAEGERLPMAEGDPVHVGDRIFIDLENTGDKPVYAAIFELDTNGAIILLTTVDPSGRKIEGHGDTYTFQSSGPYEWTAGVPNDGLRSGSYIILAAREAQDFRALETAMPRSKSRAPTNLEQLLDQFRTGGKRSTPPEGSLTGTGEYQVRTIDFQVSPFPRPVSGRRAVFAVDHSLKSGYLQAKSTAQPQTALPEQISLRLKEMVVHRNQALWRTDVRIDALVCTHGTTREVYVPFTTEAPFSRVKDEDRLPFDNLLIWQGKPDRFLDFSVWVSKARKDAKPLAELLKDIANNEQFQQAATVLAGLALVGPQAAAVVTAIAAAGTIGYFADKVISAANGNSIGLYRTSFLPHERFGVGVHPQQGVIRALDFSFSYEIVES